MIIGPLKNWIRRPGYHFCQNILPLCKMEYAGLHWNPEQALLHSPPMNSMPPPAPHQGRQRRSDQAVGLLSIHPLTENELASCKGKIWACISPCSSQTDQAMGANKALTPAWIPFRATRAQVWMCSAARPISQAIRQSCWRPTATRVISPCS